LGDIAAGAGASHLCGLSVAVDFSDLRHISLSVDAGSGGATATQKIDEPSHYFSSIQLTEQVMVYSDEQTYLNLYTAYCNLPIF
jgi:hypothetical protein